MARTLKEITTNKNIIVASHSHNHVNLTHKNINLKQEIELSKKILEEKLNNKINTIIYPFGQTNKEINKIAKQHYKYIMRIGSAINKDWQTRDGLIYRINADLLWQKNKYITKSLVYKSQLKYWLNYIRNK